MPTGVNSSRCSSETSRRAADERLAQGACSGRRVRVGRLPDRATADRSEDDSPYDPSGADWTGLADAAWLAAARIGADRATGPEPDEQAHAEEHPDTPGPLLEAVPDPPTRPEPDIVPGVTGLPGAPAYEREILTSVERTRTGPARLPGRGPRTVRRGPALLARSLRGLGRRVPTGGRSALDEESTAEHGLTDGLWVPYFLPDRERAFDLVLLVDRAPTMPPWRGTVRQIADEAAHSGAFRDVRTVGVTLPAGAGEPALRWPGGRDGDPAELIDGRSSRLFLVVTDGLAHGWAGAGADRLLERLASGGPTALVHLLPPYLRHRSSLFPFRAQLDAGGSARRTGVSSAARPSAPTTPSGRCPNRTTRPCPYRCSACAPAPSAPGRTW